LKVGLALGKDRSGLQTSPVSWLGGSSAPVCLEIVQRGRCEAFP